MSEAFASREMPKTDVTFAHALSEPHALARHSFVDSRRLTGPNRHFADFAAVLETLCDAPLSADTIALWRADVSQVCILLGWPPLPTDVRLTPRGACLAVAGPIDQLFTATEINEWAWQRAAQT